MAENNNTYLSHPYVRLARETVARCLSGRVLPESGAEIDANSNIWRERKACFVSIKMLGGSLRGCIGTLAPVQPSVDLEIIANAVSASTKDPRFKPMKHSELKEVVFSVDILDTPEAVSSIAELNPKIWGVIVSKGARRGVLLPNLEGVDDVRQQLSIASQKAGILDLSGAAIERFKVRRYPEE